MLLYLGNGTGAVPYGFFWFFSLFYLSMFRNGTGAVPYELYSSRDHFNGFSSIYLQAERYSFSSLRM